MIRSTVGLAFGMSLALASAAGAKTVSIDFTGARPVSYGLIQVNDASGKDGDTTIAQRGGMNVAMTGNTDASRYLYLQIDPAFKQGLTSVYLTVEYFDEGTGGFKVQYDGQDDPNMTAKDPPSRLKFNTQRFTRQTWHLTQFKLQGGQSGGADLRIDDRAADDIDGPEFIAFVTITDQDPDFVHFPYAVNKIVIDGNAAPAEWDGAVSFTLDRPEYDTANAVNWTGPQDFSGVYAFKWDEYALYIRGQVRDATPRMNDQYGGQYGDGQYWAGDGMEQFLGIDDSDPEISDQMVAGKDIKVMISLGTTPKWSTADRGVFVDGDSVKDYGDMNNDIAIVNTAAGYDFEMRIPWSMVHNAKVTPGQRIRWHMYANNARELPDSNQDVAMSPSGRGDLNHTMASWYRAQLDPKP